MIQFKYFKAIDTYCCKIFLLKVEVTNGSVNVKTAKKIPCSSISTSLILSLAVMDIENEFTE